MEKKSSTLIETASGPRLQYRKKEAVLSTGDRSTQTKNNPKEEKRDVQLTKWEAGNFLPIFPLQNIAFDIRQKIKLLQFLRDRLSKLSDRCNSRNAWIHQEKSRRITVLLLGNNAKKVRREVNQLTEQKSVKKKIGKI